MKIESRMSKIIACFSLISYIFVCFPIGLIAEEYKSVTRDTIVEIAKEEIKVDGGKIQLGKTSIEIPEGALTKSTEISISFLQKVEETGESLYNATTGAKGYRFLPAGTKFEKEVVITLPYDERLNEKPQSLEDLYTYFYDTEKQQWVKLERLEVDKENCVVRSLTTHFTDMINATLTLPESASPVDVNLNSIKNLEAAKPDSHLIKFNPPKASNMGDASFSFELGIPAGRKGMQPQISVSYSSGGGNGIVGKGFDVTYGSSITTDTRFGLPNYDTNDTYIFDGILLAEESRNGTTIVYKSQKETSFSKIIRYGVGTNNDYWEVTDKSGTKRIYGQNSSACVGSENKIFTWNLTKIEDVRKNNVIFEYEKDKGYVYPVKIKYTGNGKEEGNYSVVFHYNENGIQREDIRFEARSREIVSCEKLLTSITTHYKDSEAVRSYKFSYEDGIAKEKMLNAITVLNNADEKYEYTFEYTEPQKDENNNLVYFDEPKLWENGKPLQIGNSTSIGASFNAAAGVGYGTPYLDARVTGGTSGSVSSGESYTESTLVDINGDGRVDSLKHTNAGIVVALNNGNGFDGEQLIQITKGSFDSELDLEKNTSSTIGWNTYGGVGTKNLPIEIGTGYSEVYQNSSSNVLTSFMDMDRDGRVDIVETGKNTYLKNLGNLEFIEMPIYADSGIEVRDVIKEFSDEQKKKYENTYFVQTPFKMWKAPYEGKLLIRESANFVKNNSASTVEVLTFINNSEKDSVLSFNVPGSNEKIIETNQDDRIYFISDNGNEPKDTDIEWNIDIEYSEIKVLKQNILSPILLLDYFKNQDVSIEIEIQSDSEFEQEEKSIISDEILDSDVIAIKEKFTETNDELYFNFYVIEKKCSTENNSYTISLKYNDDWQNNLDAQTKENIYLQLLRDNYLLPRSYTEELLDTLIKKLTSSDMDDSFEDFAKSFEYDATTKLYELRVADEKIRDFYSSFNDIFDYEIKKSALELFYVENVNTSFTESKIEYSKSSTNENDNFRGTTAGGSIYNTETFSSKLVNLGYITDLEDEKIYLVYDYANNCILENGKKSNIFDVVSLDETANELSISLVKNNSEYELTIKLSDKMDRAINISKAEMNKIVHDYSVHYTSILDSYWMWDENYQFKLNEENNIEELFDVIELTEEEKQDFISSMYELKTQYKEIEEYVYDAEGNLVFNDDDSPKTEIKYEVDYNYYALKENPNKNTAQKILDDYKYRKVVGELFNFYEFDEISNEYKLQQFWEQDRCEDEVKEFYYDEIRNIVQEKVDEKYEKISEEEAEKEEVEKKKNEYFQKLFNELMSIKVNEYFEKNNLLKAKCEEYNLSKYKIVSCFINYNEDHLYEINNEAYIFTVLDDDIGILCEKSKTLKTKWNSEKDFSNINQNTNKLVASVEKQEQIENEILTIEEEITITNKEILYGGYNSWYYGIWKGSLQSNQFSKDALYSFMNGVDGINSEEDFNNLKNNQKIEENPTSPKTDDVSFYLPQTQKQTEIVKDVENLQNSGIDYSVNFEDALIGSVANSSKKSQNGSGYENCYYMPFISGNIIHADRAGGNAYYEIEGLFIKSSENSTGAQMTMPSIRKTITEGTDKTPSTKITLGYINIDFSKGVNDSSLEESYNKAINLGNNGNAAINKSTSISQQFMQDINGNGVPDIIQIKKDKLLITEGNYSNEIGLSFDKQYSMLSDIKYISKNESESLTFGVGTSPFGSVKTEAKISSFGNVTKVIQIVETSPNTKSGSVSYSNGNSKQLSGFYDINSDGLIDFFRNSQFLINLGSSFDTQNSYFDIGEELTNNKSESIGLNFSIGPQKTKIDYFTATSLSNKSSLQIGASYSSSVSNSTKILMDINGDGLQDILTMELGADLINVKYNTGRTFIEGSPIVIPTWNNQIDNYLLYFCRQSDSQNFDLGLIDDIPVIGTYMGEGLSNVAINPFGVNPKKYANSLDWNSTLTFGVNGNAGVNANFSINLFALFVYIGTINITGSGGAGVSASTSINGASVKMMDLDGDGLVDHVLRIPGVATYWKRNISGTYGQLNQINLPQGGNIQIEYEEQYGTVDNPNFKYVMSRVSVNDGCGETVPEINHGEHSVVTEYKYYNGYYDRDKKDFYGFETVETINVDGTWQKDTYYNREYYSKGSLKESVAYDSENFVLSKSITTLCESPYPLPEKEESWIYEKATGENQYIYTYIEYEYDGYGNCTQLIQGFADGEKLIGRISYDNDNTTDYIIGLPTQICVYDKDDNLLRKREGSYNKYGELTALRQFFTKTDYSVNTITYDEYGNISRVKDSLGATLSYVYDSTEKMFVTEISQSGNGTDTYKSYIEYDTKYQLQTKETDCNGNFMSYEYDNWQRPIKIFTSYDSTIPAVSYEYVTTNRDDSGSQALWYAITNNKVLFDHNDKTIMQTVLQVDGLGRATRTAKTGYVLKQEGWNVSGAIEYDSKGRTVKEGMTEFISGSLEDLLAIQPSMTNLFTSYEYDTKDRQVRTILPDGSIQQAEFYLIDNNQVVKSIDPLGNVSIQETDSHGNIVEVSKEDRDGNQLTKVSYEYNAMGEMLFAYDANGNPIKVEYDLLGRRTALESLDSGRQEFFYDANSNLVSENNSVLKEKEKEIIYVYDGLNRLVKINYPFSEDTVYTYGGANESKGAAGKILYVTDASGTLEYEYGSLGEVIKETRTLKTHLNGEQPTQTSVMEYRSDYLGRMQYIVYPDGEKITYGYDLGGQVTSVTGENYGSTFNYVKDIAYDEYGQRVYIEYGNGVKTNYTYDSARRWLSNIETHNENNVQFQNIDYKFDQVGNVLSYTNNCLTGVNGNYSTTQRYSYDNLYQLIRVEGETIYNPYKSIDPEYVSNYTQEFTFDTLGLGNMTTKTSTEKVSPHKIIGDDLNYDFVYTYDENYAHRLVNIGNRYYKYDSNGNIICEQEGAFEDSEEIVYKKVTEEAENVYSTDYGWGLFKEEIEGSSSVGETRYKRTYTWNEKNQLISSVDDIYSTSYVYGQDGQRSNKYTANSETLYFNKMWTLHTDSGNSIYGGQYAKNIYLGETRIVTKLNSGNNPTYQEEYYKLYFYHSDHLGSASLISDYKGDEYQRIEYTPYGETWVEKTSNTGLEFLPYKFTAKEQDEETGLYYYGARYLDPKYSMWISTDPALGEYIPQAPVNDEAKKNNQNLPGMGGIFNHINSNLYHYAGNNPVKYVDPDGRFSQTIPIPEFVMNLEQLGQEFKNAAPQLAIVGYLVLGVVLIAEGINYAQNKSLENALEKIDSAAAFVSAGAPSPLPPDDPKSKGTQTSSKTLYNKNSIHIDVENPGHRPGQIHVQQGNAKYLYDVGKKQFVDKAGDLAPKAIQKLLEDPKVVKAIAKGLEILGY